MKLPTPQAGVAHYQGQFSWPSFTLLAGNAQFLGNLFRALVPYGATTQHFKTEGAAATAAVGYDVLTPNSNFSVRVKLDTLDVTFYSLQAIGNERAKQVVMDLWDAVKNSDDSIEIMQHNINIAYQFDLGVDVYKEVLRPYVNVPKSLGTEIEPGVVFYSPGGKKLGDRGGILILDRLAAGRLNLRFSMVVDAKQVPVHSLGAYVEEYVNSSLSMLDLEFQGID